MKKRKGGTLRAAGKRRRQSQTSEAWAVLLPDPPWSLKRDGRIDLILLSDAGSVPENMRPMTNTITLFDTAQEAQHFVAECWPRGSRREHRPRVVRVLLSCALVGRKVVH